MNAIFTSRFVVIFEPKGSAYAAFVSALACCASHALLVVRDGLGLSVEGKHLLKSLESLGSLSRSSSWPGTELLNGQAAEVHRYPITREVTQVLVSVEGLYSWKQPELPEDLCLLRDDNSALLTTIAHEQDAFIDVSEAEHRVVLSAHLDIAKLLQPEPRC